MWRVALPRKWKKQSTMLKADTRCVGPLVYVETATSQDHHPRPWPTSTTTMCHLASLLCCIGSFSVKLRLIGLTEVTCHVVSSLGFGLLLAQVLSSVFYWFWKKMLLCLFTCTRWYMQLQRCASCCYAMSLWLRRAYFNLQPALSFVDSVLWCYQKKKNKIKAGGGWCWKPWSDNLDLEVL